MRGINVAGQRKVPMARLRSLHEELGHHDVVTYIQSGNVVFDAEPGTDTDALVPRIEDAIRAEFGFAVPVVLRTAEQLAAAARANPYPDVGADLQRVATAFFAAVPASDRIAAFDPDAHHPDVCVLDGREVHLCCPSGFGHTKLTNAYLERQLGVVATMRNWRTVMKLVELGDRG